MFESYGLFNNDYNGIKPRLVASMVGLLSGSLTGRLVGDDNDDDNDDDHDDDDEDEEDDGDEGEQNCIFWAVVSKDDSAQQFSARQHYIYWSKLQL